MREALASKVELPPILVSVPQAAAMLGRGVTAIYQLISDAEIRAVKSNGRTLIVVASLHKYADELPEAKIKMSSRPPQRRRKSAAHEVT